MSHVSVLVGLCCCRRGSSRRSSPSRSGYRCSRPPNRHRWQQHLPAPPSRPVPLRTKTKRMTCDPQDVVHLVRNPLLGLCWRTNLPVLSSPETWNRWYYISVTWEMHIGMDSEERDEGGFQDSHTFWYQYLKTIWIERLLVKFFD